MFEARVVNTYFSTWPRLTEMMFVARTEMIDDVQIIVNVLCFVQLDCG